MQIVIVFRCMNNFVLCTSVSIALFLAACGDDNSVTDSRDGKSYTVANLGYCYMLSNLRLDQGITLTSSDSDITPNSTYQYFTTPTEEWTNSNQNYYCKAMMAVKNHEYYYNWYAAKANPYECENPTYLNILPFLNKSLMNRTISDCC